MNTDLTAHYILNDNVDCDVDPFNVGDGFAPVGNTGTPFTGKFNGNDKTISNLFIDRDATDYVGLFGVVGAAGEVKDVSLTSVSVKGKDYVGALVGENEGTVLRSYTTGVINAVDIVGGLVGQNNGAISNSSSTVTLTTTGNEIGGFVGVNLPGKTITQSFATGGVSGINFIGGFAGRNAGTITNAYSRGAVGGTNYIGGFVGNNTVSSTITNSYSSGGVTGTNHKGGFAGNGSVGTVTNSFWDITTSGMTTSPRGTGKISTEMKNAYVFYGAMWNMTHIWGINSLTKEAYPFLRWEGHSAYNSYHTVAFLGDGTQSDPYRIYNSTSFLEIGNNCNDANVHFRIECDILSTGLTQPFCTSDPFKGTLNGQNYMINGVTITRTNHYTGIFSKLAGATITNLVLSSININSDDPHTGNFYDYVGALAGYISEGTIISGIELKSIHVYGYSSVGGLIGYSEGVSGLRNSISGITTTSGAYYINVFAKGSYSGGLIGRARYTDITNSEISRIYLYPIPWATSTNSPSAYFGGLIGDTSNVGIDNVTVRSGTIYASRLTGGLIGHSGASTITNSGFQGTINSEAYHTGATFSSCGTYISDIGGLIGRSLNDVEIDNCIANATIYTRYRATNIGGFVGEAVRPNIIGSASLGNVYHTTNDCKAENIGGFAGRQFYGDIVNSLAQGDVTVLDSNTPGTLNENVGGFVGLAVKPYISSCYATGNVRGQLSTGGFIGKMTEGGYIFRTYARGNVIGQGLYHYRGFWDLYFWGDQYDLVGGFIGHKDGGYISDSYCTGSVTNNNPDGDKRTFAFRGAIHRWHYHHGVHTLYDWILKGSIGWSSTFFNSETSTTSWLNDTTRDGNGRPRTTAQLKTRETYDDFWLFDEEWAIDGTQTINNGYPYLLNVGIPSLFSSGAGTPDDPYVIDQPGKIHLISRNPSASYILPGGEIDVGGFDPIGNNTEPFNGTFDGNGTILTGVDINCEEGQSCGFFGAVENGTIKNLTIKGEVSGGDDTGGFAGEIKGNTTIEDITLDVDVTGGNNTGGFGGDIGDDVIIVNVVLNGTVTGSGPNTGGFGGTISGNASIKNVTVNSDVSGGNKTGGFAGTINGSAEIKEASAKGNVIGNQNVGGCLGELDGSAKVQNIYCRGDVTGTTNVGGLLGRMSSSSGIINNTYATGLVTGTNNVGGLVGDNPPTGTVLYSYYDMNTTGQSDNSGKGVPKTTFFMKYIFTYYNGEWDINTNNYGWDTDAVWGINTSLNDGYPFLRMEGLGNSRGLFAGGAGSSGNKYQINICEFFNETETFLDKHFTITIDMDCEGSSAVLGQNIIVNNTVNFTDSYIKTADVTFGKDSVFVFEGSILHTNNMLVDHGGRVSFRNSPSRELPSIVNLTSTIQEVYSPNVIIIDLFADRALSYLYCVNSGSTCDPNIFTRRQITLEGVGDYTVCARGVNYIGLGTIRCSTINYYKIQ
jgi:hypothetical protein